MEPQSRAARAGARAQVQGVVPRLSAGAQLLVAVAVVGAGLLLPLPFVSKLAAPNRAAAGEPDRVELVGERSATSKTFRNADGTLTAELYADPVHFRDAEGSWREISSQLVPAGKPGYALRNERNGFEALFRDEAGDGFLRFSVGGEAFDFGLADARRARVRASGRALSYAGVYDGVDLGYEITPTGVKETLTLADSTSRSQFRFSMTPAAGTRVEAERHPDGSWAIYSARTPGPIFTIAAPVAVDAAGSATSADDVALDVRRANGGLAIVLSLRGGWLQSPERRFPVVLDPTITIQGTSQFGNFDFNCATCVPTVDDRVRIGTSATQIWRPALQFNLGAIPAGASVADARLKLYYDGKCVTACQPGTHTLDLHRLTAAWSTSSTTTAIKFDPVATSSHVFTTIADADVRWLSWDVTGLVNAWRAGTFANYGMLLKRTPDPLGANGPTAPSGRYAAEATLKPKLEVTYTGDAVNLLPIDSKHSNGADLQWTRFTGETGNAFTAYEIHRAATAGFVPTAATRLATIGDRNVTTYRDTTAAPSKTFYYKVVTNGAASNERSALLNADGNATKTLQPTASDGRFTTISFEPGATQCGNDGADDDLWLAADSTAVRRALAYFDLRDIPSGATIAGARIELWRPFSAGVTATVDVHRVTSAWEEGTGLATCTGDGATWYETESAVKWQRSGGDFDVTAAASRTTSTSGDWDVYYVHDLVAKWVKGEVPNHGVLLKLRDETQVDGKRFRYYSDDFAVAPTLTPRLYLVYADGSRAIGPTTSVAAPAPGSLVSGTAVTVAAAATDDRRVDKVELLVDGGTAPVATDTAEPWSFTWNTTGLTNADHVLTVRATDDAGNVTTSAGTTVKVENRAAPTTAITAPTGGTVSGTPTVTANASAAAGLAKVEFLFDDQVFAERAGVAGQSAYSASWNTLDAALPAYDGAHTLTTRAYDASGRMTASTAVTVTVANAGTTKYKAAYSTTLVPQAMTYDPAAATQQTIPVDVTLKNTSTLGWPTASTKLHYRWISPDSPAAATVTDGPAVSIGTTDLGAGVQRTIRVDVVPPALPDGVDKGQYTLRFDVRDTAAAVWFSAKGAAPNDNAVVVNKALLTSLGLERWHQYVGEELGGGMQHLVNVANGNSIVRWTPFQSPGRGLSTVLDLTYNALEKRCECPAGNNWSLAISSLTRFGLPLDVHPNKADDLASNAKKWLELTDGDGTTHRFEGRVAADGTVYWEEPAGVHLYLREYSTTDTTRKWALTRPDRVTFFYDAAGYPTSVEDKNGNRLTFTLESVPPAENPGGPGKRISKVTDAGGRSFTLTYWSKAEVRKAHMRGRVKEIADHTGSVLRFDYYEDGNLLRITQKGGTNADGSFLADRAWTFTYTTSDGSGPAIPLAANRADPDPKIGNQSTRLYSVRDPRGNETRFAYLAQGDGVNRWKLASRTDRAGATTSFAYDVANRVTTVTAPLARVTRYAYDPKGQVTKTTDPLGRDTTVTWSADRHVTGVTEPGGASTTYAYNANGYLTEQTNQVGDRTVLTYQSVAADGKDVGGKWKAGRTIPHISQLATKVEPKGVATTLAGDYEWRFAYDARGNLTSVTDPLLYVERHTYNADGTLATTTDENGNVTSYPSYDANGLPTEVRDPLARSTRFGYDADGLTRWIQDPLHAADTGTNDREYRSYFDYDSFHRLGRQSAPKSTRYERGQLIWSAVSYDPNDNIVTSIDPHYGSSYTGAGERRTTAYDAMDRPTLMTGPDRTIDPVGERTEAAYDLAGRLVRQTMPKGVLTPASDKDQAIFFDYDGLDRVVKQTRYDLDAAGAVAQTLNTHFCYDVPGDLRRVVLPKAAPADCSSTSTAFTRRFAFDAAHRPVSQTDALGRSTSVGYDANGNVDAMTDEDGVRTTRIYNERDELVRTVTPFTRDAAGTVTRSLTRVLVYDGAGNVKRDITPRGWDASTDKVAFSQYVTTYQYDASDRLVRVDLPVATGETPAYVHRTYDANGNMTSTSSPVATPDPTAVPALRKTTFDHFDTGWLRTTADAPTPRVHFDYSARGEQVSRTPETLAGGDLDLGQRMLWEYYADGELKKITDRGGQSKTYTYDANNNVVFADEASGRVTDGQAALEVRIAYDGLDRVVRTKQKPSNETTYRFTAFEYDLNGNVVVRDDNGEEDAAGTITKAGRRHEFTYDAADQLATQLDRGAASGSQDDQRITSTYWPQGWQKSQLIEDANASGVFSTRQKTEWTYHANGDGKSFVTTNAAGAVLESHDLFYEDLDGRYVNGNPTRDVFRLLGPTVTAGCRTTACATSYRYDGQERLVEEKLERGASITVRGWTLDPAGNVLTESVNGSLQRSFAYSGDQLVRMVRGSAATRYWYDTEGNLDCVTTDVGGRGDCNPATGEAASPTLVDDYAFDYVNRLQGFRRFSGGGAVKTSSYVSDPLDRVATQTDTTGSTTRRTIFSYLGITDQVSEEREENGAGALIGTKAFSYDAYGERVGMTATDASGATTSYTYGRNAHGDVSLLVTAAGAARASYGYTAYGDEDAQLTQGDPTKGQSSPLNPFRFNDKRWDAGSETLDMGARRFGPDLMRFIQRDLYYDALKDVDLSVDPLTQNRYAFAGGNPVSFVELDGHAAARDECTTVPDQLKLEIRRLGLTVLQNFDFRQACRAHDICYGRWTTIRKQCDERFHAAMKRSCDEDFGAWWEVADKQICLKFADVYHWGVWQYGGSSWRMKAERYDPKGRTGCPWNPKKNQKNRQRCLRWIHERSYAPYYRSPQDTLRSIRDKILSLFRPRFPRWP